ncbi:hypothetical protein T4B_9567 [Trichinella pseudospiralis]|uniref:Uncharacterized protein n=2 Tax=Trichinella pseudospiralis TaxID=6337 RepID=A0A0V0YMW6_TRIPS|nr:hypothetical protein T4E_4366 [Trichinella pseudospiralis]KRY77247.1 hypothetical protein T4A_1294 [Trichinella pseudospiralis]KRY91952.1 hypothetical protein T4D_3580 [Trichinella pseudospiralis]KRZ29302.1 hypothetical protein T4B_9567 [Trichinella pseudospiralis]KRZ42466.1 hypothetical protein T4C_2246 [Trichinella pseudospiralis]
MFSVLWSGITTAVLSILYIISSASSECLASVYLRIVCMLMFFTQCSGWIVMEFVEKQDWITEFQSMITLQNPIAEIYIIALCLYVMSVTCCAICLQFTMMGKSRWLSDENSCQALEDSSIQFPQSVSWHFQAIKSSTPRKAVHSSGAGRYMKHHKIRKLNFNFHQKSADSFQSNRQWSFSRKLLTAKRQNKMPNPLWFPLDTEQSYAIE